MIDPKITVDTSKLESEANKQVEKILAEKTKTLEAEGDTELPKVGSGIGEIDEELNVMPSSSKGRKKKSV